MNRDEVKATLLRELAKIAPEVEPQDIDPTVALRDQVDIDSMDFLNLMIAMRRSLGVDVPESDYGKLRTLDACIAYFASRAAAPTTTAGS